MGVDLEFCFIVVPCRFTFTLVEKHLARLGLSARQFGFAYSEAKVRSMLDAYCFSLPPGPYYRLRLDLRHDGDVRCDTELIVSSVAQPVLLCLSDVVLSGLEAALVQHKTSMRTTYDKAAKKAEQLGVFDLLFFNAYGQLTEGARCNVFLRIDGRWWSRATPSQAGSPDYILLPVRCRASERSVPHEAHCTPLLPRRVQDRPA
jgi:branched-subunit amino acid aminotransferase/4-amino-4-deoxychorismate lyase